MNSTFTVLQTSRPALTGQHEDSSPYTLESNADLAVQLCHTLQYSRVLLVGHADGAVAAVIAAAKLQAQRRDHRWVLILGSCSWMEAAMRGFQVVFLLYQGSGGALRIPACGGASQQAADSAG